MDRIYTLLFKAVYYCLFSPATSYIRYLFLGRALLFTAVELAKPARDVAYRSVIRFDVLAWAGYAFLIFPMAGLLSQYFPGYHSWPAVLVAIPTPLRIFAYFVFADFGHYWIHRLLHTRYFWPAHKWHHSSTYMYWLAGARVTLPQQFLVNIPYALALPLLQSSSHPMLFYVGIFGALQNDWMHMNVTWRSHWLEWFIVTPRYHHIHHSDDPKYARTNMAALFTAWDRLFGTYVDPESVHEKLTFGIGEKDNPARVVLGV